MLRAAHRIVSASARQRVMVTSSMSAMPSMVRALPRTQRSVAASHVRCLSSVPNLDGTSTAYLEETFRAWQANPASVHKSWDIYFRTGTYNAPPKLVADYVPTGPALAAAPAPGTVLSAPGIGSAPSDATVAKVVQMVRAFQVRGHLLADLDPLGLLPPRIEPSELTLERYGFTSADLDKPVDLTQLDAHVRGFLSRDRGVMPLREIYNRLKETYCSSIGFEYMHIPSVEQCNWLREKIETRTKLVYSKETKLQILTRMMWADRFERYCAKFNTKRFGLEGGESTIPGLKAILHKAAELGVDTMVLGMPHRGRLNVLANILNKPLEQIFREFQGLGTAEDFDGTGDVKYHLGWSVDRPAGPKNTNMHLSLLFNPSHLEAVNPVVVGKVRAKQFFNNDTDRTKTLGVLLHGDAAFAGQGVVYETMGLSKLPAYTVGGVIHVVVNNQIGFTTDPAVARSSPYCTDLAKAYNAPIFHVNGDDPEAVAQVSELAVEWRQKYGTDVVIDIVCYRYNGHNENDEPFFTQPVMYRKVKAQPSSLDVYSKRLIAEGVVTEADVTALRDKVWAQLDAKFEAGKDFKPVTQSLSSRWTGLQPKGINSPAQKTGVKVEKLRELGLKINTPPADFNVFPRLAGILKNRRTMFETGTGLDWSQGEAMAWASLLEEGKHVRLSGQDVERGTFSHRHLVFHDQKANERKIYTPLQNLSPKQGHFSVSNSSLSEFGVMGFELGYSMEDPHSLVMWEGQFGDFVNGAQVIMDQFLASGEDKWARQSGLVLLLPHAMEGAGPEHSSARLERFLAATNDHPDVIPPDENTEASRQIQSTNWQVMNLSTPANMFHALRRQLYRQFRKPMVVMTPKYLLRLQQATSSLADMGEGTELSKIYPDTGVAVAAKQVRRVIFCSGHVYYHLAQRREQQGIKDVAIARVEQIAPFPFSLVGAEAARFPNAEVVWAQEEHMNMGAWSYVQPRLETALKAFKHSSPRPRYVGRGPSAAPATGSMKTHERELNELLTAAFK